MRLLLLVVAAAAVAVAALADGALTLAEEPVVEAGSFAQSLDHFSAMERRTWTQHYVKSGPFSEAGGEAGGEAGPVVILLGGHEPVTPHTLADSHALEIAQQLKGVAFALEHRFFGASIPTEDMKLSSLRYLSQDQALADVASFIEHLRATGQAPPASRVVLYGGLRAGNLAAWARVKYPHLVHAAVASSAPLWARGAFTEWMDVDMAVLEKRGGAKCRQDVRAAVEYLDKTLGDKGGVAEIKELFGLCADFGEQRWDADMLFQRLTDSVSGAVDIEETPYMNMVQEACYMLDVSDQPRDKLQAMGSIAGFGMSDQGCEDVGYKKGIAAALNDRWGGAVTAYNEQLTDRLLLFLSCFEFGQFHALSSEWKNHYPLELSLQKCSDVFGKDFSPAQLDEAVRRTNMEFGAARPDIRRVVFVHGQDDPYAALGVTEDIDGDLAPVVEIPGARQCKDLEKSSEDDKQGLKEARAKIVDHLKKFLNMS